MSFAATTWAFEQPVSVTEKVVLLALASHTGENGVCWPSIKRLVRQTNVSESTVHRALKSLAAKGLIIAEARNGKNGRSTSNRYILNLNVHVGVYNRKEGVRLTPYTGEGVNDDRGEGVTSDTGEGVSGDTPIRTSIKNRQKEPSTSMVDPAIEADFAELWATYPKRSPYANPKHSAFESYVKARTILKVPHETILEAAKAYALCVAGKNPQHTAQAVTWLNQRRWGDEYDPAPADIPQTKAVVPPASDEQMAAITAVYKGPHGDLDRAKANLAAELAKGVELKEIVEAAQKYVLYVKQMQQNGVEMAATTLDTWLKFKWREMDAYYIYRNPVERNPVLKAMKDKGK